MSIEEVVSIDYRTLDVTLRHNSCDNCLPSYLDNINTCHPQAATGVVTCAASTVKHGAQHEE